MDNLEKYLDQVMETKPVVHDDPLEMPPEEEAQPRPDLFGSIARRWPIVLITTIVICGLGLPAVWLLIAPTYTVRGAVSVLPPILVVSDEAAPAARSGFQLTAEADTLRSDPALHEEVVDRLRRRDLAFFDPRPRTLLEKIKAKFAAAPASVSMIDRLRQALADGTITVSTMPNSDRLVVAMRSTNDTEAKAIVDAFLGVYESRYRNETEAQTTATKAQLQAQHDKLVTDMGANLDAIREEAQAYGGEGLERIHAMALDRQENLLRTLTSLQLDKSRLVARQERLDSNDVSMSAEQRLVLLTQSINEDPDVVALSQEIAQQQRELIALRALHRESHPELKRQEEILAQMKTALEDRRKELEDEFDESWANNLRVVAAQQSAAVQAELDQVQISIDSVQDQYDAQRAETLEISGKLDSIQERRANYATQKAIYDRLLRNLQVLDVEGQGRPRVQIAYYAFADPPADKRMKFSAAVLFLALGCGSGLALLRDKTDKTLQSPEDIAREIDLPVLGTTSSSNTVKPSLFAEQIAADYQTIRTNLGLLTNGGIPRKLAVSSPGMREGKTTFAVNLATSLAKGGKRVLLIDGDLRKPDVRFMLNITNGANTVQDVLAGVRRDNAIYAVPTSGLHVLVASARKTGDVYELLASSRAAEQIERLGREYDHVIIDTPPVLAFPDALIWARMAGAVVLVGFAGTTTGPELKEAKEKFARVRVQVLGAILSNVRAEQGLYRYGYGYRAADIESVRKAKRRRKLLLPTETSKDATKTQDA